MSVHVSLGSSSPVISLLPSPTGPDSWTVDLPLDGTGDEDQQSTDPAFVFDGDTTAIEVPLFALDPVLGPRFSISVWMKHENSDLTSGSVGNKEHILCSSDGEGILSRFTFHLESPSTFRSCFFLILKSFYVLISS